MDKLAEASERESSAVRLKARLDLRKLVLAKMEEQKLSEPGFHFGDL